MTEKYYWLNKDSRTFLERGYLLKGETAEGRVRDIADTAERILGIAGFADEFEEYISKGYYSLSSPVWANFGRERALPISCFGSHISDCMNGIMAKVSEVATMTKHGGGTSAYFGDLRPRGSAISAGGESTGPVHFMELFDTLMNVVSQGSVRRGTFAAYLPIEHPDVAEFLEIKSNGCAIQDLNFGITVTDAWMRSMMEGDQTKRKLWGKVIQKKFETGYPYIVYVDNANNQAPQVYKDKKMQITHSNVCSEIMLPDSADESFVCCLSSLNLEKWDEWKDNPRVVQLLVFFLDAVMTEFIDKTENMPYMEAPRRFAQRHRALGVGVLGWHTLLQSKRIAFESMDAKFLNSSVWQYIRKCADEASVELAQLFGEPELLKGCGRRNTTTLAVAPTTSSSFILGQVSPSIEPLNSNYYVRDLAKGKFTYKNSELEELLTEKGQNNESVWRSILTRGGSVQHLDFLSREEKDVFKTFGEISQREIIIQAAQRQKYIDQGQSLNLMIPPDTKPKDVNSLMIFAWEQGIKSLYYQRGANPAQELARNILNCTSCEA
jgi:ribonucleoside-diphosphate reductase alpha chain